MHDDADDHRIDDGDGNGAQVTSEVSQEGLVVDHGHRSHLVDVSNTPHHLLHGQSSDKRFDFAEGNQASCNGAAYRHN